MAGTPIQVFGTRGCQATRKAKRFFKERRMSLHMVDLKQRAASKGELKRFAQKFGVECMEVTESTSGGSNTFRNRS